MKLSKRIEMDTFLSKYNYVKYNGEVYPYKKQIGDTLLLMDFKGRGFNTLLVNLSDVEFIQVNFK